MSRFELQRELVKQVEEQQLKIRPSGSLRRAIEAKLELPALSEEDVAGLASRVHAALCLADYELVTPVQSEITDSYFDDESLSLHSRGLSLRVRRRGDEVELTLKVPTGYLSGGLVRDEVTLPLSESDVARLDSETLEGFLRGHLGGFRCGDLQEVLRTRITRLHFRMNRPGEEYKLSIDAVAFSSSRSPRQSESLKYEIEIEPLNPAALERLPTLRSKLADVVDCDAKPLSKYESGVLSLGLASRSRRFRAWIRSLSPRNLGLLIALLALIVAVLAWQLPKLPR